MENKPHWPDVLSGVRGGESQGECTVWGSSWDFHLKGQGLKGFCLSTFIDAVTL